VASTEERVDVEAWDGEPTFRVNGKTFVFSSPDASGISVKLPKEEAAAVVATDPSAEPTGYGLGRRRGLAGERRHPRLGYLGWVYRSRLDNPARVILT
jgi:hypothetical protein